MTRGVVGFRLHRVLDVHAGFSKRHEDLVMDGISENGAMVKVRVVSYAIDGKPVALSDAAALAAAYEDPKQAFAQPFDPRCIDAYSYRAADAGTIAFTSVLRDAQHGDGSFTYDGAYNVVSYTYQPNALPPHASWGTVTDRRAEVLPGYWAVTHETQQFKGSYGPFAGAGTEVIDFSGFQRFADLQSALRSIQENAPNQSGD